MGSNLGEGRPLAANLISVVGLTNRTPSADLFSDELFRWPLTELSPLVTFGRNRYR